VLGQETLDQVWSMSAGVVMVQLSVACVPQLWSLAPNCITEMTEDFLVVLLTDSLASLCVLMMHNTPAIELNSITFTAQKLSGFFGCRGCWMKVSSIITHGFPTISQLLTPGKNIAGYFLDRPCIVASDHSGPYNSSRLLPNKEKLQQMSRIAEDETGQM
jgi:hypothetical protein